MPLKRVDNVRAGQASMARAVFERTEPEERGSDVPLKSDQLTVLGYGEITVAIVVGRRPNGRSVI